MTESGYMNDVSRMRLAITVSRCNNAPVNDDARKSTVSNCRWRRLHCVCLANGHHHKSHKHKIFYSQFTAHLRHQRTDQTWQHCVVRETSTRQIQNAILHFMYILKIDQEVTFPVLMCRLRCINAANNWRHIPVLCVQPSVVYLYSNSLYLHSLAWCRQLNCHRKNGGTVGIILPKWQPTFSFLTAACEWELRRCNKKQRDGCRSLLFETSAFPNVECDSFAGVGSIKKLRGFIKSFINWQL